MPKYCLDTSGFSNPLIEQPEDIYISLWESVRALISQGLFCWNAEIASELEGIYGPTGSELKKCNGTCCYEIGNDAWPWQDYLELVAEWQGQYKEYISEYNSDRKNTIGLNDLSIVAMAKVMGLPIVSMEKRNVSNSLSTKRMRIPDLCDKENIEHLSFIDFLQAEGIKI